MAGAPRPLLLALLGLAVLAAAGGANAAGRKTVGVYELRKGDFSVRVTNWGATLTSVVLPDSKGNLADVVLGYDTIAEYVVSSQLPLLQILVCRCHTGIILSLVSLCMSWDLD